MSYAPTCRWGRSSTGLISSLICGCTLIVLAWLVSMRVLSSLPAWEVRNASFVTAPFVAAMRSPSGQRYSLGSIASLEHACHLRGGVIVGGHGSYSCSSIRTKIRGPAPSSTKQNNKNTDDAVSGTAWLVVVVRLYRAFLNGLWGSFSNSDDVVSTIPEGERVDAAKRYWYNHRRSQRSGYNVNPRSVTPPVGGWRPRTPMTSFWGRSMGGSECSEDFLDLEGGYADDDDEESPLLPPPGEAGDPCESDPTMNVELVTPTAPTQRGSSDSPDLVGPGPEDLGEVCECSGGTGSVRMRLYRTRLSWAHLSRGLEWLVMPFIGGEDADIAFALGFRSYRWVDVDQESYESAYRKIAGMRLTSGHTIDAIRYQCQTLGADLEELPRALLQRLMFCRVRDNVCGAGETGVSVGTLNSLVPGSSLLGSSVRWLLMSPRILLMSIICFLVVSIRGVARVLFLAISRRSLRDVRTDRELSDIGLSLAQLFGIGVVSMMSTILLWGLVAAVYFTTKWVWLSFMRGSLVYFANQVRYYGLKLWRKPQQSF